MATGVGESAVPPEPREPLALLPQHHPSPAESIAHARAVPTTMERKCIPPATESGYIVPMPAPKQYAALSVVKAHVTSEPVLLTATVRNLCSGTRGAGAVPQQ